MFKLNGYGNIFIIFFETSAARGLCVKFRPNALDGPYRNFHVFKNFQFLTDRGRGLTKEGLRVYRFSRSGRFPV